jgi:hypothetical protein
MRRFNNADGEVAKRFSLMPSTLLVRQSTADRPGILRCSFFITPP